MNFFKKKPSTNEDEKTEAGTCIICEHKKSKNPICESCMSKVLRPGRIPVEFKILLNRMNYEYNQPHYKYNHVDIADLYHGMEKVHNMINEFDDMEKQCDKTTAVLNETRSNFSVYKENTEEELSEMRAELKMKNKLKQPMKTIKKSIHNFFDV